MCLDLNLRRDRVCTEAQTWHTPSSNGESTGWEPGTSRFQYLHDVGDDEPHWPCEEEGGLDEPISHSPALDAGPIPLDAGGVGAGRSGGAGESASVFADHLMQEMAVHAAKMARECALLARQGVGPGARWGYYRLTRRSRSLRGVERVCECLVVFRLFIANAKGTFFGMSESLEESSRR